MAKVKQLGDSPIWMFECPGCGQNHGPDVTRWTFNNDVDRPTFRPSLLVSWEYGEDRIKHVCHSYVTDGRIQFLDDCTHRLAGQTVDLPEFD